jgi:hypothetical protein
MAIWQDLVDGHGFTGRYASVKRFVRKLRGSSTPEARVVIETAPGEEAQVDYGTGPMVRDPQTGKYRRTRLFVLTLGHSRKSVRLLVFRSSTRVWAELHEKAFRRLGGVTRVVVLDNLREGVLTPDIYDPTLNPLYRDVLKHYGAVALPCRVNDPDRKGKVESGVGHAQKTPLKGSALREPGRSASVSGSLGRALGRHAHSRHHQAAGCRDVRGRKTGAACAAVEPFRYYQYGERTVHLDGCVEVEAAYYGAPPGWIGRRVQVQWNDAACSVARSLTGQLLREHLRQQRGRHRIQDEDRPFEDTVIHATAAAPRRKGRTAHRRVVPGPASRITAKSRCAASWACSRWPKSTASLPPMTPAPWPWKQARREYHFVRRYLERGPQLPLSCARSIR